MNPLIVLAACAALAVVLGSWASFRLGRMSRPTTTLSAAPPDSETTIIVGPEAPLSNLDKPKQYFIELGQRVTPPPEEQVDPRWGKTPPRDGRGRFLKKPVG